MPLYEYECQHCHRRTEKIQKFADAPLTACPHCGGPLEQLIHAPAVSFKGGGWYADLYSSSKKSGAGDAKSDAGSSAPASGEGSVGSASKEPASTSTPAPSSAPVAPTSSTGSEKK
jgi:putative FmdB family regulatory protein